MGQHLFDVLDLYAAAQYPADFRETITLESTEPAFANLVARFTAAVKDRDWTLLSSLLARG